MAWSKPSLQTIIDRIENGIETRLTGGIPLLRYAILKVLARVFGMAIYLCYGYIEYLAKQIFVMTAEGEFLDRLAYMWGITRKAGTYSTGEVQFTGVDGSFIESGTIFQDDNGHQFKTVTNGTILSGSVLVNAMATEEGIEGNILSGVSIYLIQPVTGVNNEGTANVNFVGGTTMETDEELRVRLLDRIQNPPAGGAVNDYIRWAKEVDGVDNAWCFGQTPSNGAVTTVIKASGVDPVPSSTLIDAVATYINDTSRKPATADSYIVGIVQKLVKFTIKINPKNSNMESTITSNMQAMLLNNGAPGENILLASIQDAILKSGVTNYEIQSIEIDGVPVSIADLVFTGYEYPVFESIIFSSF